MWGPRGNKFLEMETHWTPRTLSPTGRPQGASDGGPGREFQKKLHQETGKRSQVPLCLCTSWLQKHRTEAEGAAPLPTGPASPHTQRKEEGEVQAGIVDADADANTLDNLARSGNPTPCENHRAPRPGGTHPGMEGWLDTRACHVKRPKRDPRSVSTHAGKAFNKL